MAEMMEKVSTSLPEQETIVNICAADNKRAGVYTCIPKDLRRMWKLYKEYPDKVKLITDNKHASEFEIPAEWVKIRPKRKVSEEQKTAAAERLARIRSEKNESV